jgi:hypothetical protein
MIIAERQHLEDLMAQQAIELRIKEQRVLLFGFETLASTATYLCAASFAVLRCTPAYLEGLNEDTRYSQYGWRHRNNPMCELMTMITMGLASCSIGFCVLILVISSWVIIFGQDLAFRGDDQGSMTRAVDGLYKERKMCVRFFMVALAMTLLSGCFHIFLFVQDQRFAALPAAILFILGVIALSYMTLRVRPRFQSEFRRADGSDLYFHGGFDPEVRRHVEQKALNDLYPTGAGQHSNPLIH